MITLILIAVSTLNVALHSANAAPFRIDLSSYSTGSGDKTVGPVYGEAGSDAAQIGDHNGDGLVDYMVGAQSANMVVIVMKGSLDNSEIIDMATVVSGQYFRVIRGPAFSRLGSSVGGIGDINDDSFDDVIMGAPEGTVPGRGSAGYAYVLFGMEGPFTDLEVTATWAASSLGFMILGPSERVGLVNDPRTARGLGDVNGDGVDDFAVAARAYSGTSGRGAAGHVWLIPGRKGLPFDNIDLLPANFGSDGIVLIGPEAGNLFGQAVMPAGDFNGDGLADFLIGALYARFVFDGADRMNAGAAYLFYGAEIFPTTFDMANFVTGTMGVRFGADTNQQLGHALGGVGDVNDDGFDDIGLGAMNANATLRALCSLSSETVAPTPQMLISATTQLLHWVLPFTVPRIPLVFASLLLRVILTTMESVIFL